MAQGVDSEFLSPREVPRDLRGRCVRNFRTVAPIKREDFIRESAHIAWREPD
jgi:hypothetical protein